MRILFLLLVVAMPSFASPRQPQTLAEWSYIRHTLNDPYRKIDGTIIDLTPFFVWNTNDSKYANPMPEWKSIIGKIISVGSNGIIINVMEDFRETKALDTVWLRNYPLQRVCVDGDPIAVTARQDGRKQYRSPIGAVMTVPAYNYGERLTPDERQIARNVAQLRAAEAYKQRFGDPKENAEFRADRKAATDAKVIEFQKERAAAGSAQAQYDLGLRYLTGAGVGYNLDEARRLLQASAAQDFKLAIAKLKTIETNAPPGKFIGAIK